MRWRRGLSPVRRESIDRLRHLARRDQNYVRPLAVELLNGASQLYESGRFEEALPLLDEMVAVLKADANTTSGTPDTLLITALGLLGSTHLNLGYVQDAEERLDEAIALATGPTGSEAVQPDLLSASNLLNLARCRESAGARKESLELLDRMTSHLRHQPSSDPQVAELLQAAHIMRLRLRHGTGEKEK